LPSFSLRQQKKKVALEGETFNKGAFTVFDCASAQQHGKGSMPTPHCSMADSRKATLELMPCGSARQNPFPDYR
jgi:hypothetical protein